MTSARLTIDSRNYGWRSLSGWLLCKLAGLEFQEQVAAGDDPDPGVEALPLPLPPTPLMPCLEHDGVRVWDTIAIAEHLHEHFPDATLLPSDPVPRGLCRAICCEVHSEFQGLRAALPMNAKQRFTDF
jgi:glutathione S-transferase